MTTRAEKSLTTYELVTVAIYLLGGERRWIDTEDVAVKTDPTQHRISFQGQFSNDAIETVQILSLREISQRFAGADIRPWIEHHVWVVH